MGRLGDADWWWEHGLDGIAGGVVAGLVTVLAIWLTLRHERRSAQLLALEAAAADLQGDAITRGWVFFQRKASSRERLDELTRITVSVNRVRARAVRRWPGFAVAITEAHTRVYDLASLTVQPRPSPSEVGACGDLGGRASRWLVDPRAYEPARWQLLARRRLRRNIDELLMAASPQVQERGPERPPE